MEQVQVWSQISMGSTTPLFYTSHATAQSFDMRVCKVNIVTFTSLIVTKTK